MHLTIASRHWIASLVLAVALPLGTFGDEPAKSTEGQSAEDAVAREIEALKKEVKRLADKVDKLANQPSQFSLVSVRVVDERGEPSKGFSVRLRSSDEAQTAAASGVSDEDGKAINRWLPYGRYLLSVSGNGWYASWSVTVEVSAPLELTVAAPLPDQLGRVAIEPSFSQQALEGLPFGGWRRGTSGAAIAPEPDARSSPFNRLQDSTWASFPTVSNGIETVAISVRFEVERRIRQPNGGTITWQWRPALADGEKPIVRDWFIQSDGAMRSIVSVKERNATIPSGAEWFSRKESIARPGNASGPMRLEYVDLATGPKQREIELPAGAVKLIPQRLYGLPSADVQEVIRDPCEPLDGEIWLRAVIMPDSAWFRRLLGDSLPIENRRLVKAFDLPAGESQTITLGAGESDESN